VNKAAAIEGRLDDGFIWAGEGVGLIRDIPTARELIERMVREAAEVTERTRRMLG
jgi:enoyl-[acyl-carrier protein] reductase II